jgi:hypothetical protein
MRSRQIFCSMRFLLGIPTIALGLAVVATAGDLQIATPQGSDRIQLTGADSRWQLVVTAQDSQGDTADWTRQASFTVDPAIAEVSPSGFVKPLANGEAVIRVAAGESAGQIRLSISGMDSVQSVDFHHQVIPIFTKLGCNGGGCHGKAAGQAGFKLSLLGFEPEDDYQRLVLESRGRRLFPAVPDQSLLLLKAVNAAPHGGGQRLEVDSHEYRVLRRWIAAGCPLSDPESKMVTKIEAFPSQRRLARGLTQQIAVWATYSDGTVEDITRTAQFESNNKDLANVDEQGWVQLNDQPGDVAIMARYQGQVAVTQISIPLGYEVDGLPPEINLVDTWVFDKLKTLGIPPSELADDTTLIRRATLDICGRLPTVHETLDYVGSDDPAKYERLVNRLLDSPDYASFFARKWVLILRNGRKSPGKQFGSFTFHQWLEQNFHQNKPYDEWVGQLLTASGSIATNPAITWWREVPDTESRVEDAAQLFLGQRLQCARCHHHPFEKWSQEDYFRMAAFFSKVAPKEGTTADNPVFVSRVGGAGSPHPKTGQNLTPAGLDSQPVSLDPADDPRQDLVEWMIAPDNPFFSKSLVNRYWKHFMASGLVEPEDDMRVTNPPTNRQLMDALGEEFIASGYDIKHLIRTICLSSTYRLKSDANEANLNDSSSYSRFYPKRLNAEVLLDAIDQVLMTATSFEAMPGGTRAVQLPDTGFPSYFLDVFGRPAGMTACECERSNEATLAQSLHLLNSKEIAAKLTSDAGKASAMSASSQPVEELVDELYLAALSRRATESEKQTVVDYVASRSEQRRQAFEDVVWAIINSKEFLFNH